MESEYNMKYKYLPDVQHIMKQAGYSMNLTDILNEAVNDRKEIKLSDLYEPELFYYAASDINGKNRWN